MDPVPPQFQPKPDDVLELVRAHPLAWVVSPELTPLLVPIRPVLDGGSLTGFHGHLTRSSRLCADFAEQPRGLLLFSGSHGYISPSWCSNRRQAPTWASASAAFQCRIFLTDNPSLLRDSLTDLVAAMEGQRTNGWRLDELGDRYDRLAERIVAFRAEIVDRRAAFRLGQDEDDQSFAEILGHLRDEGRPELAGTMARFRR